MHRFFHSRVGSAHLEMVKYELVCHLKTTMHLSWLWMHLCVQTEAASDSWCKLWASLRNISTTIAISWIPLCCKNVDCYTTPHWSSDVFDGLLVTRSKYPNTTTRSDINTAISRHITESQTFCTNLCLAIFSDNPRWVDSRSRMNVWDSCNRDLCLVLRYALFSVIWRVGLGLPVTEEASQYWPDFPICDSRFVILDLWFSICDSRFAIRDSWEGQAAVDFGIRWENHDRSNRRQEQRSGWLFLLRRWSALQTCLGRKSWWNYRPNTKVPDQASKLGSASKGHRRLWEMTDSLDWSFLPARSWLPLRCQRIGSKQGPSRYEDTPHPYVFHDDLNPC